MVALHYFKITPHFFPNIVSPCKSPNKYLTISAKKREDSIFPLKLSKTLIARSAVAVLGLGFIDAGYSGDWSRIGVISKEIENLLKFAAFLVVPLCIFLIFYIIKDENA